jgi:hypothetical protein
MMKSKLIFVSLMFILFLGGLTNHIYSGSVHEDVSVSVTHHSIKINGKILKYQAAAGVMPMKDEKDKPMASIFLLPIPGRIHKKTLPGLSLLLSMEGRGLHPYGFTWGGPVQR